MPSIHTLIFQVAALACAAGLAACVSVTPYQPASKGYGYSEQRIENNRFRINFAGNSDTPKQTVETYLLFRAAELTLKSGYDYFVFASDSRSEEHTSELQSLMRISYAVFCLKTKKNQI